MYVIGVTGGIGCGKSTVAQLLKEKGAVVIDADRVAHELYAPGTELHKKLVKAFGGGILKADKTIDRAELGSCAFTSPKDVKRLNSIVHRPLIMELRRRLRELRDKDGICVLDAALLMEWNLFDLVDKLVVVFAQDEVRLERLRRNRDMAQTELKHRIESQIPQQEKTDLADWVIDNSMSLRETRKQVEQLWKEVVRGSEGLLIT